MNDHVRQIMPASTPGVVLIHLAGGEPLEYELIGWALVEHDCRNHGEPTVVPLALDGDGSVNTARDIVAEMASGVTGGYTVKLGVELGR